jgi:hypothetical protein
MNAAPSSHMKHAADNIRRMNTSERAADPCVYSDTFDFSNYVNGKLLSDKLRDGSNGVCFRNVLFLLRMRAVISQSV